MKSESLVDVVIPVWNGERFIEEAMASVEGQDYQNWSGWVVDDGSTDASLIVARERAEKDERWTVISCPHLGISGTINEGLSHCQAPYLSFLDADDLWMPDKLSTQVAYLEAHAEAKAVFGLVEEFIEPGTKGNPMVRPGNHRVKLRLSLLCKRSLAEELGSFNESQRVSDFIDWFTPAVGRATTEHFVDRLVGRRRVHNTNTTRTMTSEDKLNYVKALHRHLQAKRNRE